MLDLAIEKFSRTGFEKKIKELNARELKLMGVEEKMSTRSSRKPGSPPTGSPNTVPEPTDGVKEEFELEDEKILGIPPELSTAGAKRVKRGPKKKSLDKDRVKIKHSTGRWLEEEHELFLIGK